MMVPQRPMFFPDGQRASQYFSWSAANSNRTHIFCWETDVHLRDVGTADTITQDQAFWPAEECTRPPLFLVKLNPSLTLVLAQYLVWPGQLNWLEWVFQCLYGRPEATLGVFMPTSGFSLFQADFQLQPTSCQGWHSCIWAKFYGKLSS